MVQRYRKKKGKWKDTRYNDLEDVKKTYRKLTLNNEEIQFLELKNGLLLVVISTMLEIKIEVYREIREEDEGE